MPLAGVEPLRSASKTYGLVGQAAASANAVEAKYLSQIGKGWMQYIEHTTANKL